MLGLIYIYYKTVASYAAQSQHVLKATATQSLAKSYDRRYIPHVHAHLIPGRQYQPSSTHDPLSQKGQSSFVHTTMHQSQSEKSPTSHRARTRKLKYHGE